MVVVTTERIIEEQLKYRKECGGICFGPEGECVWFNRCQMVEHILSDREGSYQETCQICDGCNCDPHYCTLLP